MILVILQRTLIWVGTRQTSVLSTLETENLPFPQLELLTILHQRFLVKKATTKQLTGGHVELFCLKCLLGIRHFSQMSPVLLAKKSFSGGRLLRYQKRPNFPLKLQIFSNDYFVILKTDLAQVESMRSKIIHSLEGLIGKNFVKCNLRFSQLSRTMKTVRDSINLTKRLSSTQMSLPHQDLPQKRIKRERI